MSNICLSLQQAVKNLVFLAKVLHRMMETGHMTSHADHVTDHMTPCVDRISSSTATNCGTQSEACCAINDDQDEPGTTEDHYGDHCGSNGDRSGHRTVRDLHWLVGRMDRLARQEAGKTPHQSLKVTRRAPQLERKTI